MGLCLISFIKMNPWTHGHVHCPLSRTLFDSNTFTRRNVGTVSSNYSSGLMVSVYIAGTRCLSNRRFCIHPSFPLFCLITSVGLYLEIHYR